MLVYQDDVYICEIVFSMATRGEEKHINPMYTHAMKDVHSKERYTKKLSLLNASDPYDLSMVE